MMSIVHLLFMSANMTWWEMPRLEILIEAIPSSITEVFVTHEISHRKSYAKSVDGGRKLMICVRDLRDQRVVDGWGYVNSARRRGEVPALLLALKATGRDGASSFKVLARLLPSSEGRTNIQISRMPLTPGASVVVSVDVANRKAKIVNGGR